MRPRSPALAPFISSMGYLEGRFAHRRERVLPTGTMQLLVNLDRDALHSAPDGLPPARTGGAALQGPHTRSAVVDTTDQRAVLWVDCSAPRSAWPPSDLPGYAASSVSSLSRRVRPPRRPGAAATGRVSPPSAATTTRRT